MRWSGGGWQWPTPPRIMNLLVWNCRGLGSPRAVQVTTNLVKKHKPQVLFLIETKEKYGDGVAKVNVEVR